MEGMSPETLRQLVHDHYQAVYRFAFRLSGSSADAEDLTQQAFLTACRKLDQLRSRDCARSWLFTIVRNAYLKGRPQKTLQLEAAESRLVTQPNADLPDEFDEEKLQRALDDLPEVFRLTVLLYYFEDLSYKEISDVLGVPIGTVMSRLSRGKHLLREQLTGEPPPVALSRKVVFK